MVEVNGLPFAKPCDCRNVLRLAYVDSMIPQKFKGADISTLEADTKKHVKQPAVIAKIKANPLGSYLFLGRQGAGKTWFGYALWKNAVLSGRRGFADTAQELNLEFRRYEISNDDWRPRLLAEDLKQDLVKYSILLDEFDKIQMTPFSVVKMFELVKAASDYGHQLIVTTNARAAELKKKFDAIDEVWGASILRRITENATIVEMFDK